MRDTNRTKEQFEEFIDYCDRASSDFAKGGASRFSTISAWELRAANAAYCAGHSKSQCLKRLKRVVKSWSHYLEKGCGGSVDGISLVFVFIETIAAAAIIGEGKKLTQLYLSLYNRRHFAEWEKSLLGMIAYWQGVPVPEDLQYLDYCLPPRFILAKPFAELPPVIVALKRKQPKKFASAMEEWLSKGHGPAANSAARGELKEDFPHYYGKWSLLSLALIKEFGSVPPLSKKALSYVPVDLL